MTMTTRELEPFVANVDCPHCAHLAVHWLEEPRLRPERETPAEKAIRTINESIWMTSSYAVVNFQGGVVHSSPPHRWYDPPGSVVARVCVACGYRWGQV